MKLKRINPRITDSHGSMRVIEWLKKMPDPPEALISYWEGYRQNLVRLSQQAQSSSLYPCSKGCVKEFISHWEYYRRKHGGEEVDSEIETFY